MVVTTTPDQGHHWRIIRGRTIRSSSGSAALASNVGANVGHFGLGTVGLLLVLISAWGGIVPFVGPAFGYSADGAGSWHWSLTHSVVALVPGALGVLIGLMVLGASRGMNVGRGRFRLAGAGLLAVASGAWLAIAPWAWPVMNNQHTYFVLASPLRLLANVGGYALGPGLIMAACGAFFIGWSSRHQNIRPRVVRDPAHQTVVEPASAPPVAL